MVKTIQYFIIDFDINLDVEKMTEYYRNIRKTDWEGYKQDLATNIKYINLGTDIDTLATSLENCIISSFNDHFSIRQN